MVIPEHDFVRWPLWAITSTHKRKNVASEEHLNDADSSIHIYKENLIKFLAREMTQFFDQVILEWLTSDKLATEWYRIKNAEACLSANCEAVLLLIESNVADLLRFASFHLCHCVILDCLERSWLTNGV